MFLKKVEISGFKSFAHKTTLEFMAQGNFDNDSKRGITAVVGPNGSGKSNVADAVRWAMGEQSMKNLRGKKSEDIIFAGSGQKSRLGSASVTLHFDNSDKRIPLEFSEVTIARKLFRSGESEYLINGSKVRLLDVTDLLAKAGIGRESYCVINQGMSDAVLNATPTERRMILEDAAGVKQYQIQKERSAKKLDLTRTNLDRVRDLVAEIEPHLRMLKRQAARAEKGKEIAEALREKQVTLFSHLWHNFQQERESNSSEKNERGARMMNRERDVDKITDEISKYSKEVQNSEKQDELEKKREDLRQKINELEKELVITEGRLIIEEEKRKSEKIIESIPVDLTYVKEKLERIRKNQEQLIERLQKTENMEQLQDIKEFARAIQQELFDLYHEVGVGKVAPTNADETQTNADTEADKRFKELENKKLKIKKEIGSLKAEFDKIGNEIEKEIAENKESRRHFFELEHKLSTEQIELNKLKDEFNEAKIKLARVEVREEDLTNEIRQELKLEPKDLITDKKECNEEESRHEINKLKVQMEQIGGIDPLVVEEYEETKNRHEFLTKESDDLERAIQSLKKVIDEMDAQIGTAFAAAYAEINKEFTKYFRIIFGGGQAHLIKLKVKSSKLRVKEEDINISENGNVSEDASAIVDSEVEEVGLDISACPPGKRISSLAMLSGGERSLTSLALLFAIISYNPPPFAILDEVEAALDEANSKRFGRIIQELSNHTQFIIITHNRETMRQASLLYGVTMGDDGISKLLSVKLDQVKENGKIVK